MPKARDSKDVRISKSLSYILRHGAEKEGISITKEGFIKLDDLLKHKTFKNVTVDDVFRIVQECPKQRFYIDYFEDNQSNTKVLYIRANQGHSLGDLQIDMKEITELENIDFAIHGTYYKNWDSIKNQGLSRMNRQHIHFSVDLPDSKEVISGMRSNCQIAIYVDIKKALKDGLKFYRSANNVILCPGDEAGFLKPIYFSHVLDLKTNTPIEIN